MCLATRCLIATALLGLVACGGASEERVSALEAQVKELQRAGESAEADGSGLAALEKRVAHLEVLEKSLQVLENAVEANQKANARARDAAAVPADDTDAWADAWTILGVETTPVSASGDRFTVNERWLIRELRALAVTGKSPKFTGGKRGVVIRGFKPGSMFDLLGLKNGDIITKVNGAAVTSVDELAAALRQRENPATIGLERRRKPLDITFEVVD